jgi:DNA-directed RNA polymerase subunit RPC12/RpoP
MLERWKLKTPRDKSLINIHVLHQETFNKFGYYPEEISHASSKEVAWKCLDCPKISFGREKDIKKGKRCLSCAQRIRTQNRNQQMKEQGLAPNGIVLGTRNKVGYREKHRLWRKKWRATPIGCLTNRLRVSLKRVHKGMIVRYHNI